MAALLGVLASPAPPRISSGSGRVRITAYVGHEQQRHLSISYILLSHAATCSVYILHLRPVLLISMILEALLDVGLVFFCLLLPSTDQATDQFVPGSWQEYKRKLDIWSDRMVSNPQHMPVFLTPQCDCCWTATQHAGESSVQLHATLLASD